MIQERNKRWQPLALALLALVIVSASFLVTRELDNGHEAQAQGELPGPLAKIPRAPSKDFSGKTLHFQAHIYEGTSNEPVVTDVWIKIGPNNEPQYERALSTFRGEFDQAVFKDLLNGNSTIFVNSDFHEWQGADSAQKTCRIDGEISPDRLNAYRNAALPFYVSAQELKSNGFKTTTDSDFEALAIQGPKEFGDPDAVEGSSPRTTEVIRQEQGPTGISGEVRVSYDEETGLVLGWLTITDTSTASSSDFKEERTAVEVFDGSRIPDSYFNPQDLGGCK